MFSSMFGQPKATAKSFREIQEECKLELVGHEKAHTLREPLLPKTSSHTELTPAEESQLLSDQIAKNDGEITRINRELKREIENIGKNVATWRYQIELSSKGFGAPAAMSFLDTANTLFGFTDTARTKLEEYEYWERNGGYIPHLRAEADKKIALLQVENDKITEILENAYYQRGEYNPPAPATPRR